MHKYASMAKSADAKDLKSFGSNPISVQIRLLAPTKMREITNNPSHFCYLISLGTNWGQKTGIFKAFMHKYKCSFLSYKKLGTKTQKERLPDVNVRQPLSLQFVIDFFDVAEVYFI